ncbi:MAG: serine hydrolase, partial [Proteobacteria bacterium]|nr:serine hydrolase [Pseudomonadota bacterium]
DKYKIKIIDLLSHSSGLPAYRTYFKDVDCESKSDHKEFYLKKILNEPLEYPTGSGSVYSDLGFILLGFIIEKLIGRNLDDYLREKILDPIGIGKNIFFQRHESFSLEKENFVPMEICPWRKRLIQGEVSDENCWALGGVAGHAGLFADLDSVLALTAFILDMWQGRKTHPEINNTDLQKCLRRREEIKESSWALGFDTPTVGKSSSGRYFSPESVGHLGFTGTSFWIDPERDLVVVLLTNRIHPSRGNEKIKEFRPYFHDRIIEILGLV